MEPRSLQLATVALSAMVSAPAQGTVLDDFDYPDNAAARAAWVASTDSTDVTIEQSGEWGPEHAMLLPCDFSTQEPRAYWDRDVSLDLTDHWAIAIEVWVPDPAPVSVFTLYLRSGAGWYSQSVNVDEPGWQTWIFGRGQFSTEDNPSGWHQIDRIRLSPWRNAARDTYLVMRQLRAYTPTVLIINDASASEKKTAAAAAERVQRGLRVWGIDTAMIPDADLEPGALAGSRITILPYNPTLTDSAQTALETFVGAGGRLMAFYSLAPRVGALLGVENTGWTQGEFGGFTFSDTVISGLPERVRQGSWNIRLAAPAALDSRVIASWEDVNGQPTGDAAWIASDHGLFMSHVLLNDDPETAAYMLLALIAHYVPEVLPTAADAALHHAGTIADYTTYDETVADITERAENTWRRNQVEDALARATVSRQEAEAHVAAAHYLEAVRTAVTARDHLSQAYYLCHTPEEPEWRGVWEHSGAGPYAGDWPRAIDVLAGSNFNAVVVNSLRAGLAHYPSQLLPHSEMLAEHGDQVAAVVEAAHARGLEAHIWKVNWNLSRAPAEFVDAMRAAERTQMSSNMEDLDWLCPSHPENLQLERDTMLEVVNNYDVDGIHFDYIRYPDNRHCFCHGCRTRFQEQTGRTVAVWPEEVVGGGVHAEAYLEWRRQQITRLVEAVYIATKETKPNVRVSAAVFADAAESRDRIGQDWVDWVNRGIIDFVCPMDYTEDFARFEQFVATQMGDAAGRVPVYPGIGARAARGGLEPDGVIAQVLATRRANTGGFIVFDLAPSTAESHIPVLGMSATANTDTDSDGEVDTADNCPLVANPSQTNSDDDAAGDACDSDDDDDGIEDSADRCPLDPRDRCIAGARALGCSCQGPLASNPAGLLLFALWLSRFVAARRQRWRSS